MLFLISIFFLFISNSFIHVGYFKIIGICSILFLFIFFQTKFLRIEKFHGKYSGIIVFEENSLVINSRQILVSEIDKIYLRINDYEGKTKTSIYRLTNPMSNGTNNLLDFDLKSGEKIKVFFKVDYEGRNEELRPFISSLINQNIISEVQKIIFLESGIIAPEY